MYPHRIRLHGPWLCEPLARAGDGPLPEPMRMKIPCRWSEGLTDFAGKVRFRRRFGYPGQIDNEERVWLTFAGVEGKALVRLNGQVLGIPATPAAGFEYEVTALLSARNELEVEIEAGPTGGLRSEVALEIRRTAFLRGVSIHASGGWLHVEGEVAGSAERPLELYVIVGRSTAIYATIDAGKHFALSSETLTDHGTQSIRVDLVDGATVWYTLERECKNIPAHDQEEGSEWNSSR